MSALTSTFFFGWILPLAVTAATRLRRPTFSKRTSVPFSRLALALTITRTTRSTTPPPPSSTLFRLDMSTCSSRLAQAAADRGFQRGQRLMVIVNRVHVVVVRPQPRHLGVQQLEERARAHPVALGGELQLLPRRRAVRVLESDRAKRRLQRQVRLAHLGLHGEAARPHRLLEVPVVRPRLRHAHGSREVREQRQRDREAGLERLARELKREHRVLIAQRLLVLAAPHIEAAIPHGQSVVAPDDVVLVARRLLLAERVLL